MGPGAGEQRRAARGVRWAPGRFTTKGRGSHFLVCQVQAHFTAPRGYDLCDAYGASPAD